MLQYLINISIIWLACLLLYELLLRKESFHQCNRIYLLASLAAGLLVPTATLNRLIPPNSNVLHQHAEQVREIKKALLIDEAPVVPSAPATFTSSPAPAINPDLVLWTIYLLGVAIGITLIAREVFQLVRLYRKGNKTSGPGFILIETGKGHCPFSFFNIIFIRSRQDYSHQQWTLLTAHEKEHSRLLHSIDKMWLIILRIVFWFHPLPHLYYKKLMMLHEFQADNAAAINKADYGNFLLEQSLLQQAPVLMHSINYSPIKKRITMLTRTRSARAKLVKYLAVVPLSFILILFCTQISFSGDISRKGNGVYFKGNKIELEGVKIFPFRYYHEVLKKQASVLLFSGLPDTILADELGLGKLSLEAVRVDSVPVAINGKPILGDEKTNSYPYLPNNKPANAEATYTLPVVEGAEGNLERYLFSKLKGDLDRLANGSYILDVKKVVIDEHGNIAYYERAGLFAAPGTVSDDTRSRISRKLIDLLDGPLKFKPALKDGKPVNVRLKTDAYEVEVKNHVARLTERRGC